MQNIRDLDIGSKIQTIELKLVNLIADNERLTKALQVERERCLHLEDSLKAHGEEVLRLRQLEVFLTDLLNKFKL